MAVVTTEYSGGGDPRRSIELLWRIQDRPRRGPKPKLTVDQVARAAIEIADREGLAALSMRRVADALGVTAMSVYTYVPSKAELIDVMLDMVYGEIERPGRVEGGWRARLEQVARQNRDLYLRHPWMLQVATGRPVLGPNLIAKYDAELRAIDGVGLSDVEMDLTLTLIGDYVHGAARSAVEAVQAEQRTGMTDDQWWGAFGPLLEQVLDADRYPVGTRVGDAVGAEYGTRDPARAFEFGLARLLDGVETLINAHRRGESGDRDR
jgi:AcrR family transcriptional regulator